MIATRSSRFTKLQESELRFRFIIQSAIGAVILTNSKGKIILWNKAAEHIFGYPKKKILGKHLSRIIPEMAQFAFDSKPSFIGKIVEMQGLQKGGGRTAVGSLSFFLENRR
jgi:PAS domain-containing protein